MTARHDQTREMLRKMLDELDHAHAAYSGPERRLEPRLSFRRITPPARIVQGSGDILTVQTITRNLSSSGVSLLHKPFAHLGSNLVLTLSPSTGKPIHVAGRVLSCRYVGEHYHESSVMFDEKINLDRFLSAADQGRAEKHLAQVRRRMDGVRILLIDPTGAVQKQFAHSFEALGANLIVVQYLGKALDAIRTTPVDLLFCGHSHDGADASQIVRLCRDSDYLRPIIALGWPAAELTKARSLPNAGVIASVDPDSEDEALDFLGTLDLKPRAQERAA